MKRRRGRIQLGRALAGQYDRPLSRLSESARKLVEEFRFFFGPPGWDGLTPKERRLVAEIIDLQRSAALVDKQRMRDAFIESYRLADAPVRKRRIAERNKRNSKRPRPKRQRVSDDGLVRMKATLTAEGVPTNRQIAEARKRLLIKGTKYTPQGLRKRWNHPRLSGRKKET